MTTRFASVALAAALIAFAPSARVNEAAAQPELTALFTQDGPAGEGWLVRHWEDISKPPKWPVTWDVKGGVLEGTGRFSPGNSGDQWIGTWLLSEREYGDFILELEFKFRNGGQYGNGGVALRTPLKGDPAYDGMELQITDERFERSYFPDAGQDEMTGALYLVKAPSQQAYKPGEWNHYRIDARGPALKVWLNGVQIHDLDLDALTEPARKHGEGTTMLPAAPGKDRPRRGHIGLQDLSENGEVLLFRNVRIAALD